MMIESRTGTRAVTPPIAGDAAPTSAPRGRRRSRRRRATGAVLLASAAVACLPAVAVAGPPAPRAAGEQIVETTMSAQGDITAPGLYKTTYSDVIYLYEGGSLSPLTFAQWQARGFPPPTVVRSEVVKYAWSPTLYAVTFFEHVWLWNRLTPDEWQRMGFQAPYNAGWIAGSVIGKYGTSPHELFIVGEDDVQHKLTYEEWAATGFEPVEINRFDVGFVQFRGSPTIYYVVNVHTPNEDGVPISFAEWAELGMPTPELR